MNEAGHSYRGEGQAGLKVWREVEEALEEIIEEYEKVNHVISLFQDEKIRRRGLEVAGPQRGVGLEIGSGPGNFTSMLQTQIEGSLVCLDYSAEMLSAARTRVERGRVSFVRGIFEALPFRSGIMVFAGAAYALRDSTDKLGVLRGIHRTLRDRGRFLIIDIGKPRNRLVRGFFSLYMRYVVPIMGGMVGGYGIRNPWRLLFKTYDLLPTNRELANMLRATFGSAQVEEHALGGLIVAVADKTTEKPQPHSDFLGCTS